MKVEVVIDETCTETIVKIIANQYSKDLDEIRANLLVRGTDKLIGFQNKEVYMLDCNNILRFYTEDNKVYCDTSKERYQLRLKMYELENKLSAKKFIKISRSEIINLDYVARLDLSFTGTIALEMLDRRISYVSRRYLSKFKEALGL